MACTANSFILKNLRQQLNLNSSTQKFNTPTDRIWKIWNMEQNTEQTAVQESLPVNI